MPVDRPTFHESWYRVAEMTPRLRPTVQVHRQRFRGRIWHVVQDPSSNQFYRLNPPAYRLVSLLDGRRTVRRCWELCNEQLGDEAPTQGEVIQLLGQLYAANLLRGDVPPDAEGLFERYSQRRRREVTGYLTNFLFLRIPLIDPDCFLTRWVGIFGKLFTVYGGALWLALVSIGLYHLVTSSYSLTAPATGVLDADNLLLLYAGFWIVKVFHEFGHGFACKKMGLEHGGGGQVHVMGIMLLVFTPLPYVDASSAWALPNKWQRTLVGASGMLVELAVAAVAAVVWANTGQSTVVHNIAYNVMFVASVSTLLFNGNPLLRYDGYYILSDLVEIPNLSERSKRYIYYLVKRYAWGVKRATSPAHTRGERAWMVFYGIASTAYRVVICVGILMFVAQKFFIVGVVLALAALVMWLLVPLGKFVHYLFAGNELARVRARAVVTTVVFAALVFAAVGVVRFPDRFRATGVVEPGPGQLTVVYARADGFLEEAASPGAAVESATVLVRSANPEYRTRLESLQAELDQLQVERRMARTEEYGRVQDISRRIDTLRKDIERMRRRMDDLVLRADHPGRWVGEAANRQVGAFVRRGEPLGMVVNLDKVIVRVWVGQTVDVNRIELGRPVTLRLQGRPDIQFRGTVVGTAAAGLETLPSEALGYAAGGTVETDPEDRRGRTAAERGFEVRIEVGPDAELPLRAGQRVVARFETVSTPLALQWWRWLLQLVQRRFTVS